MLALLSLRNLRDALAGKAGAFARGRRGSVAIEFAIITPVFMFFLLGALATFDYYRAKRRAVLAADTVADLVARTIAMNDDEMDLVVAAGRAAMDRYATAATVHFGVASISEDEDGNVFVNWSEATSSSLKRTVGSKVTNVTVPEIPSGEVAILAELSFEYKSPVANYLPDGVQYDQFSVRRPRYTAVIGFE